MQLFLSQKGYVASKHVLIYNQIAEEIRLPFTLLIDSLSKGQQGNIDWWVSSPMSRDNLASPLFSSCCSLVLLQVLLKEKENINLISTDSLVLKKVIKKYLKENGLNIPVVCEIKYSQIFKQLVFPVLRWLWICIRELYQWFQVNRVINTYTKIYNKPLTLIDTYIVGSYNENKDRYYEGLWNNLDKMEQDTLYFVPTIIVDPKNEYKEQLLRMSQSKKKFLFKEKFLKLRDYLFVFLYPFRIAFQIIPQHEFMGFNIVPLIKSELRSMTAFNQVCIALLNYRFAKRLKNNGVMLRLVMNWFENQILDKGWNLGFRKFYPKTLTVGYAGYFVPQNWLARYPSENEFQSLVIPEKICVVGRGLIESTKLFCDNLDVVAAPAFRFQSVWEKRKYIPNDKHFNILIALPILMKETIEILRLVATSIEITTMSNLRIRLKAHPLLFPEKIKLAFGRNWPSLFEFVKGDFNDCIEKSHLLVSNASSVCVETLAKGIPVIVVGGQTGLTQNPIPETITDDIWKLCYTPEEMVNAVEFYASRNEEKVKQHQETGGNIRENYFEPITRDSVYNLLQYN